MAEGELRITSVEPELKFTYSKSKIETLEKEVKYIKSKQ